MNTENNTDTTQIRCNVKNLAPGDRLSRISYLQVVEIARNGTLTVKNEEGRQWTISPNIVGNECYTANQFDNEVELTRTELIEVLERAGDSIFTITFTKDATRADATQAIQEAIEAAVEAGEVPSLRKIQAVARTALTGAERTLVGYLASTEPKMGRSQVIDLEADGSHRLRLVNHRTISSLILRNTKYTVR